MYYVVVLQLGIFLCKIFFYRFSIKNVETITSGNPEVTFFVSTHIIYTQVRKAISGVDMLKRDALLCIGLCQVKKKEKYGKGLFQKIVARYSFHSEKYNKINITFDT